MKNYSIHQGELFDEPVEFRYTDFDFTDCEITSKLRLGAVDGKVVHEFEITPTFSLGLAEFRIQMTEAETAALKIGNYIGDFKIERNSPAFGPFFPAKFCINISKPATRND
jgi:hypothetical protein